MAILTQAEKLYLEKLLEMEGGYVLDFSDASFAEFFSRFGIDIHGARYQRFGTSKAKKLRVFWDIESDALVGAALDELLDRYEVTRELSNRAIDRSLLRKCRSIAARLNGDSETASKDTEEKYFLRREVSFPRLDKLPVESTIVPIIESRIAEAQAAMEAGAHLSVIFLSGSVLEAVLLGAAQANPARFNGAAASPKEKNGAVKRFSDWNLSNFIDVAAEIGLLKPDVKKFSHGLRDFRNYIHPYQQWLSKFNPDEHTAKLCLQVLKAALASVAGERN